MNKTSQYLLKKKNQKQRSRDTLNHLILAIIMRTDELIEKKAPSSPLTDTFPVKFLLLMLLIAIASVLFFI